MVVSAFMEAHGCSAFMVVVHPEGKKISENLLFRSSTRRALKNEKVSKCFSLGFNIKKESLFKKVKKKHIYLLYVQCTYIIYIYAF